MRSPARRYPHMPLLLLAEYVTGYTALPTRVLDLVSAGDGYTVAFFREKRQSRRVHKAFI